ncbi:hypothetical protein [Pelotalea chapellei]|uniref:Uncharacterized protein n=1 Tax=Pelotalea chapellei TaxID=44671 RepID=A0ABS5UAS1_9BACT|nr:hypothetical protein [Pelotalea chapellei]MBT1072741.1 hypothetical protein [Pelotalea chapellei]
MNIQVKSDLPTIYADMSVFRYLAYGEIAIEQPERFRWVYSHVHLNEMARGGNTDALDGMRLLKAVEICNVLNGKFESVGNIVLKQYLDPSERYRQHLDAIAGHENSDDFLVEHLLRIFGADNFVELSMTPEMLRNQIDHLASRLDTATRGELVARAEVVSADMKQCIDLHLQKRRPIDQTRLQMGLTSSVRKETESSDSPIDAIWEIIGPSMGGIPKDQFFGFERNPCIEGLEHTQEGALAGAHMVLNLLGFSPDKGLSKRDRIRNIISDGQHVGMASYCNALLSGDKRFCDKANAIYTHAGSQTAALWFPYNSNGCLIRLDVPNPNQEEAPA